MVQFEGPAVGAYHRRMRFLGIGSALMVVNHSLAGLGLASCVADPYQTIWMFLGTPWSLVSLHVLFAYPAEAEHRWDRLAMAAAIGVWVVPLVAGQLFAVLARG